MKNPNAHLFKFCPQCGKKALISFDKKSFLCRSCNFKFYLNTAAAGIALIFNKENELLVTKRKYNPAKGSLDLPGGFAEPGETIEACLIREIKEELNIDIFKLKYFCSVPNTYPYKNVTYHTTDFVFLCSVNHLNMINASDDISDFYFMDLQKINTHDFGLDSVKMIIDQLTAIR